LEPTVWSPFSFELTVWSASGFYHFDSWSSSSEKQIMRTQPLHSVGVVVVLVVVVVVVVVVEMTEACMETGCMHGVGFETLAILFVVQFCCVSEIVVVLFCCVSDIALRLFMRVSDLACV
jgi:hypothetical protein